MAGMAEWKAGDRAMVAYPVHRYDEGRVFFHASDPEWYLREEDVVPLPPPEGAR